MAVISTNSGESKTDLLPVILLIILALIWGSSFILMKRGLEVYSYEQVGALRIVFSFAVMLFFLFPQVKKIPLKQWKYLALVGVLGNLIPAFLFAIAVSKIASSLAGILNALTPLFTLIIGMIAFRVQLNWGQTIGLVLGFLGCVELSLVNGEGGLGSMNLYILFVVAATVCYAISANIMKTYLVDVSPITMTACAFMCVGPIATIYLFSTDFLTRVNTYEGSWTALTYLIILGTIGTAGGLILLNIVIKKTSAVFGTSVTYIIPIVAVFWGIWDGEQIFILHYVGMAFITLGVYIVGKYKRG